MQMPMDSEHCRDSDDPTDAASRDGNGPLMPCCSVSMKAAVMLDKGPAVQTADLVIAAVVPEVATLSRRAWIPALTRDVHESPPGRHGFLHDLSVLRI